MQKIKITIAKYAIPSMILMNSASTAIDGISLFCLRVDKGDKPRTGLPPQPLLYVDNFAINDFPALQVALSAGASAPVPVCQYQQDNG